MESTHEGELPIDSLPKAARTAHIFPALQDTSLISIGQLCDAGCEAHFTATEVHVTLQEKLILHGTRDAEHNGLWYMELPSPHKAMHAVNHNASPENLVKFAHAALFSPANSTLLHALQKNFLPPFTGLTVKSLRKYPPISQATIKGHLDTARKNHKSTKQQQEHILQQIHEDAFPPQPTSGERTNAVYAEVYDLKGQIHSDLTGRLPTPSSQGHHYLLVVYCYDSNAILLEPLKNRKAETILTGFQTIHRRLVKGGCRPLLHRLDNECSDTLKEYLHQEKIDFQLVPPHNHRRNAAERAIRTAKNHLIAGWCSADPDFPMHLWSRTIPHAEISLNLLRGSRINPKLSAWEQLFGRFDFNRTPIAPPGIRVLAHLKSTQRESWQPHALDGWYIGPALESYRCHRVYITSTRKPRICDTVTWLPKQLSMPVATPTDLIRAALNDIAKALKLPNKENLVSTLPPSEVTVLNELAETLTNAKHTAKATLPESEGTITQQFHLPKTVRFAEDALTDKDTRKAHTKYPAEGLRVQPNETEQAEPQEPPPVLRVLNSSPQEPEEPPVLRVPTRTPHSPPRPATQAPAAVSPSPTRAPRRSQRNKTKTHHSYFAATDVAICKATKILDDLSESFFVAQAPKHFALKAVNPDTGLDAEYAELLQSSDGKLWERSMCMEIGRLFQGWKEVQGTDTCKFIPIREIPTGRTATYCRIVVADRPRKTEPRRVRLTVGGDRVDYPGEVSTKTTDLITAKILLNSVISTPNARFMGIDIKDYYLNNVLPRKEYLRIPIKVIPQEIIDQYNLMPLVHNGYVYVEVSKGMYGLPQAGRVAYDALLPRLLDAGYEPAKITPGLFRHKSNSITFCLCVDDFGVKYTDKNDALHLRDTLKEHYTITEDWEGANYCGLDLDWNYDKGYVDISMKDYVRKALQRFEHSPPNRKQHAPSSWTPPKYGKHPQMAPDDDDTPPLEQAQTTRLKEVIGTFLFYARAVDNTMLVALGSLAAAQSKGTEATMQECVRLLNYAATHPDAIVRFRASGMILHIHSDASYQSEPKSRSRVGGYYFLDGKDNPDPLAPPPQLNGAIHVECRILRPIMASATEAETAGLFHNGQEGAAIRTTLAEMGHPQPGPTPIQTDNQVATGIATDTVKTKRTKAMDMRFYWIRDRVRQGQFRVHWKRGADNRADYYTKHFPPSHHQAVRPTYLQVAAATVEREGV